MLYVNIAGIVSVVTSERHFKLNSTQTELDWTDYTNRNILDTQYVLEDMKLHNTAKYVTTVFS